MNRGVLPRTAACLLMWGGVWATLSSCQSEEVPLGPPRCEPSSELQLERTLKEAYRALHQGERGEGRRLFSQVLSEAPGHPEAMRGLRKLEAGSEAGQIVPNPGHLMMAGRAVPVPLDLNVERYRFEEESLARKVRATTGETPDLFGWRLDRQGKAVAWRALHRVQEHIDLLVIQDSRTVSARRFFHQGAQRGRSTHFTIDADGTVFQNLDVGHRALTGVPAGLEGRALSLTMVNPLDVDSPPGTQGQERPRSPPKLRRGKTVRHWGYTLPQSRSLQRLVVALVALFPHLKGTIPSGSDGAVASDTLGPEAAKVRGIVGQYHVSATASGPTVAFPWEELKRALATRPR